MTGAELPTTVIGLVGMVLMMAYNIFQNHRTGKEVKATGKKVTSIDGTVNNRDTPMRDDLDELSTMMRDVQDRTIRHGAALQLTRTDVNGLRTEVGCISDSLQNEITRAMAAEAKINERL